MMRRTMASFGMILGLVLVSAAFGQDAAPAQSVTTNTIAPIPPASPAPMPVLNGESKDGWWISDTIAQSRKDQPVFFGVRLANAPQAALAETYKRFLAAGETLDVRLWGCNDLPREFTGRAQVLLKKGDKQFASEDKTVRLAPETVKRLAKYSFDTDDLAAGQYALETSLFNDAGELVQQQVIAVTIRVTQKQELARRNALAQAAKNGNKDAELNAKQEAEKKAAAEELSRHNVLAREEAKIKKAEKEAKARALAAEKEARAQALAAEKAKKDAELKAQAEAKQKAADEAKVKNALQKARQEAEKKEAEELSRRSALAKAEAEAQALAAEKAKKDAELKARAEAKKQAAAAEAAKKLAEQKIFEETKAKYLAREKEAIAVKTAALAQQETECQTRVTQAEADRQAAETQAAALALEAKTAQADVAAKEAAEARAKQAAKKDAPKDVKAKLEAEAKIATQTLKQADLSRRSALAKADAAKRVAEDKAEAVSDAKAMLAKQRKNMIEQKADLEAQTFKNAERQAKAEIKANEIAAKARQDAELKAQADLSRRSALAEREARQKAAAEAKARAQAEERARKDAELKARVEAEKQAAAAAAAKKVADKKIFEETKAKYLAREKEAIAVKVAALAQQETECQTKVTQAEADRQAAETQAAVLALAAKTAQADVAAKEAAEARAKQAAKKDAPKDVKAKLEAEAKIATQTLKQADLSRRSALAKADAVKRVAEDKAEAVSDAKAKLAKQRKSMAEQKADLEAQAIKNAERQAKEEVKANEVIAKARQDAELKAQAAARQKAADEAKAKQAAEAKVAREAKVKARIEARAEVTPAGQPATEAQTVAGKPAVVASTDLEKKKWRVAVGMLYRRIGAQGFKTMGSYSRGYGIAQKSTDDHWVGPAGGMGDAGNRVYDNGYVGSDDYSELDVGTWNWGYNSGQQVNGNQIEFTGVSRVEREYSRRTTVTDVESSDNAAYAGGLMLEAERYLAQSRFVDAGLSLGLSRAQTFAASASGINTFNDSQWWGTYNNRVLDAYDITGLGITPASAPYKGNRNTQGPVINTSPMSRRGLGSELVSEETYRAYNSVKESLDMDLSTLSLGMSVKGNYQRVYVIGSTGPTLNMVEKDASYEETLYESSNGGSPRALKYWSDSSSENEYLFGYYVQAEVGVRIYRELHLGVFGRYDWLENVSGSVGPSRYEVNPTGGSMGGTIGLQF